MMPVIGYGLWQMWAYLSPYWTDDKRWAFLLFVAWVLGAMWFGPLPLMG